MNIAYLLTGSNLGNRKQALEAALNLIVEKCGEILAKSSIYATQPWGLADQPEFFNQAVCISTPLEAEVLINEIFAIEIAIGRKRETRYGPRIIDIDILLFNSDVIRSEQLCIPHYEMPNRRFVLMPLAQIAGVYKHPVTGLTILEMLQNCKDQLTVAIATN